MPEIARAPELKDFVCLYEVSLGLAELEDLANNPEMWPVLRCARGPRIMLCRIE